MRPGAAARGCRQAGLEGKGVWVGGVGLESPATSLWATQAKGTLGKGNYQNVGGIEEKKPTKKTGE
jgi:hypothetical protein